MEMKGSIKEAAGIDVVFGGGLSMFVSGLGFSSTTDSDDSDTLPNARSNSVDVNNSVALRQIQHDTLRFLPRFGSNKLPWHLGLQGLLQNGSKKSQIMRC